MLDNDCNTQQAEKHTKRLLCKELETYHKVWQSCLLPSIPISSTQCNSLNARELFLFPLFQRDVLRDVLNRITEISTIIQSFSATVFSIFIKLQSY